jgi:DNA topoisomerase-1
MRTRVNDPRKIHRSLTASKPKLKADVDAPPAPAADMPPDVVEPTKSKKAERPRQAKGPGLSGEKVRLNKKKAPLNPIDNPEWFFKGERKWKAPPPGVVVSVNPDNVNGTGWIEKWQSPTTNKPVHNYTLAEMERRAGEKFASIHRFAENIEALESQLHDHLTNRHTKPAEREAAIVVALIHHLYIRVGNEPSTRRSEKDAEKENTYGITTMLVRHWIAAESMFDFVGKSEQPQKKVVTDPLLARIVNQTVGGRSRDETLFSVKPAAINRYLRPFGGTAKSFRTYHATRMAALELAALHAKNPTWSPEEREAQIGPVIERVAERIGHTAVVCRSSYVDPAILELFVRGKLGATSVPTKGTS